MAINKGQLFVDNDVFIDYAFEEVMFRWDHVERKVYVRFYGEDEKSSPVRQDSGLFNQAILSGEQITQQQYEKGRRVSE